MICEWCGHEHDQAALCSSRPRWSRRGFIAMFGAGLVGLAVAPKLPVIGGGPVWSTLEAPFEMSMEISPIHSAMLEPGALLQVKWVDANEIFRVLKVDGVKLTVETWKPFAFDKQ